MNYDEILKAIDDIDTVTLESEISVCSSMLDVYNKMKVISEYYEGDSIEAFSVYQEGFTDDVKTEMKKSGQNKSTAMKILTVIPRLIKAVIASLKKKTSDSSERKKKVQILEKAFADPENKKLLAGVLTGGATAAGAAILAGKIDKKRVEKLDEAIKIADQKKNFYDDIYKVIKNCNDIIAIYKDCEDMAKPFYPIRNADDYWALLDVLSRCDQVIELTDGLEKILYEKIDELEDSPSDKEELEALEKMDTKLAAEKLWFKGWSKGVRSHADDYGKLLKTNYEKMKSAYDKDNKFIFSDTIGIMREYATRTATALNHLSKADTVNSVKGDPLYGILTADDYGIIENSSKTFASFENNRKNVREVLAEYARIDEVYDAFDKIANGLQACQSTYQRLNNNLTDPDKAKVAGLVLNAFNKIFSTTHNDFLIANRHGLMESFVRKIAEYEDWLDAAVYILGHEFNRGIHPASKSDLDRIKPPGYFPIPNDKD